jgi:hypothetical protein
VERAEAAPAAARVVGGERTSCEIKHAGAQSPKRRLRSKTRLTGSAQLRQRGGDPAPGIQEAWRWWPPTPAPTPVRGIAPRDGTANSLLRHQELPYTARVATSGATSRSNLWLCAYSRTPGYMTRDHRGASGMQNGVLPCAPATLCRK